MNGEAANGEHNCHDSIQEHWHNTRNATWTICGVCKRVTGFHYKRFLDRLKALFKCSGANPIKI